MQRFPLSRSNQRILPRSANDSRSAQHAPSDRSFHAACGAHGNTVLCSIVYQMSRFLSPQRIVLTATERSLILTQPASTTLHSGNHKQPLRDSRITESLKELGRHPCQLALIVLARQANGHQQAVEHLGTDQTISTRNLPRNGSGPPMINAVAGHRQGQPSEFQNVGTQPATFLRCAHVRGGKEMNSEYCS